MKLFFIGGLLKCMELSFHKTVYILCRDPNVQVRNELVHSNTDYESWITLGCP